MASVFLTGASGFVGSQVCRRLLERGHRAVALRRARVADETGDVRGDLLEPASYEASVQGVDAVVHLAAITGKAAPSEYARERGRNGGAPGRDPSGRGRPCPVLQHHRGDLSGQAALFLWRVEGRRRTPCRGQRAATTVIRPTVVAGVGSPVMTRLFSLAALPVVPAFGGARASVQPILVDDLADFVVEMVESDRFRGEVLELGGPEVLPVREVLDRMHRLQRGRRARFLNVPLAFVLPTLALLERLAYPVLPVTVGQLATFRFDGVARPNTLWEGRRARLASVDQMIVKSVRQ